MEATMTAQQYIRRIRNTNKRAYAEALAQWYDAGHVNEFLDYQPFGVSAMGAQAVMMNLRDYYPAPTPGAPLAAPAVNAIQCAECPDCARGAHCVRCGPAWHTGPLNPGPCEACALAQLATHYCQCGHRALDHDGQGPCDLCACLQYTTDPDPQTPAAREATLPIATVCPECGTRGQVLPDPYGMIRPELQCAACPTCTRVYRVQANLAPEPALPAYNPEDGAPCAQCGHGQELHYNGVAECWETSNTTPPVGCPCPQFQTREAAQRADEAELLTIVTDDPECIECKARTPDTCGGCDEPVCDDCHIEHTGVRHRAAIARLSASARADEAELQAGLLATLPPMAGGSEDACPHPPSRYYSWFAYDGTLCVACCDCGAILQGALPPMAGGSEEALAHALEDALAAVRRLPPLNDAHYINIVVRRNGRDELYEADWLKYLRAALTPATDPLPPPMAGGAPTPADDPAGPGAPAEAGLGRGYWYTVAPDGSRWGPYLTQAMAQRTATYWGAKLGVPMYLLAEYPDEEAHAHPCPTCGWDRACTGTGCADGPRECASCSNCRGW